MFLSGQPDSSVSRNPSSTELEQVPIRYRGWPISTKVINGKLWLRWQHPQESFPRYGCPVTEEGLAVTVNHVRFMIDLAIKLESEMPKKAQSVGEAP